LRFVRESEQLLMQAVVEHRGEFLRSVVGGKIWTSNVANKQGVSGEDRLGTRRIAEVGHRDTDAFHGMARGLKESEPASAELEGIAVLHRGVWKFRAGTGAEVNPRSRACRKFVVAGDEIGVQMSLDDVLDFQPALLGGFQINLDVPLQINHRGGALRSDQIGSVGQTAEEDVLDANRSHLFRRSLRH
jgi:hypothetical protein